MIRRRAAHPFAVGLWAALWLEGLLWLYFSHFSYFGRSPRLSEGLGEALFLPLIAVPLVLALRWALVHERRLRPTALDAVLTAAGAALGWALCVGALEATGRVRLGLTLSSLKNRRLVYDRPSSPPALPEGRNAVPQLLKAARSLSPVQWPARSLARLHEGRPSPEDLAMMRSWLRENGKALALVQAAQDKPASWEIDWSKGPDLNRPFASLTLYPLSRLLLCKAVLAARDGRGAEAVAAVRAQLRLIRAAQGEPVLMAYMIGGRMSELAAIGARYALPAAPRAAARSWQDELKKLADEKGFREALKVDLLAQPQWAAELSPQDRLSILRKTSMDGAEVLVPPAEDIAFSSAYFPFWSFDVAHAYDARARLLETLSLPYADSRGLFLASYEAAAQGRWILPRLNTPQLPEVYPNHLIAVCELALARTALSASLYRRKNGRWPSPDELRQADAGLPKDPFTGGEFLWGSSGGEAWVYSPGPLLKDEGGRVPLDPKTHRGNIAWKL